MIGKLTPTLVRLVEQQMLSKGTITNSLAKSLAKEATHNPNATEVVLGKYVPNSGQSYEAVAFNKDATWFEMENWSTYNSAVKGSSDEMWKINKAFLDQQVQAGKTFTFTVNPFNYPKSFTMDEYNYLLRLKQSNPNIIINLP